MTKRISDSLIVLLGPTAVGKTSLAVEMAIELNGEIISADSRQVYRRMDLGTGKDLGEYQHSKGTVPYHLIDILEPGEAYDVFHFQRDLYKAYAEIVARKHVPILCGGTGLYLEAALREKQYIAVPENNEMREKLMAQSTDDLVKLLLDLKKDQHNTTDLLDRDRIIRAIEIAAYEAEYPAHESPIKNYQVFGLKLERPLLRDRIKQRLSDRLNEGMIQEVESLLEEGVTDEMLRYYGLEYRYIAEYLSGQINDDALFEKLLQAIRRFAKKQMTWYRRMEKQGVVIHWMDAEWSLERKMEYIRTNS